MQVNPVANSRANGSGARQAMRKPRHDSVANSTSAPNCIGPISESAGYNLDSGASCGFSKSTDLTTTDPLLGPLFNYGGPTSTMALLPGSPAIDHGGASVNGCPTTDQRGVVRPQGPACDIGAYEATP